MKLNNPQGMKSSFTKPSELEEQVKQAAPTPKEAPVAPAPAPTPKDVEDWPMAEEVKTDIPEDDSVEKMSDDDKAKVLASASTTLGANFYREMGKISPTSLLKAIGLAPSEDDFHSLLFRGFIEKTIDICKNPVAKKAMTAKLRSLTAEEMDYVDELIAEDIDSLKVTTVGIEQRRSLWVMSFGVREIEGRSLCRPIYHEGTKDVDAKQMARERRKVLSKLNPILIDEMIRKHALMVNAYNAILFDKEGETLKN